MSWITKKTKHAPLRWLVFFSKSTIKSVFPQNQLGRKRSPHPMHVWQTCFALIERVFSFLFELISIILIPKEIFRIFEHGRNWPKNSRIFSLSCPQPKKTRSLWSFPNFENAKNMSFRLLLVQCTCRYIFWYNEIIDKIFPGNAYGNNSTSRIQVYAKWSCFEQDLDRNCVVSAKAALLMAFCTPPAHFLIKYTHKQVRMLKKSS